ncbi:MULTISPECIES: hypothetical protein [unclassified Cryobacterium]|nr:MULTISPECIES: hypothetical protein [unclassified Cryobacterium]
MPLIPSQTLVTVTVPGYRLEAAVEALHRALVPYADAHIIALTQSTN